jgi:hypothetical protein
VQPGVETRFQQISLLEPHLFCDGRIGASVKHSRAGNPPGMTGGNKNCASCEIAVNLLADLGADFGYAETGSLVVAASDFLEE